MTPAGALLGFIAGVGVVAIAMWVLRRRRPDVVTRLSGGRQAAGLGPWASLRLLVVGTTGQARTRDLELRLAQAGRSGGVREFRVQQWTWSAVGGVLGGAFAMVFMSGESPVLSASLMALAGAGAGALLCRQRLGAAIKVRRSTIEGQLPSVAELLAFAVSAGQSPGAALQGVADTTSGELPTRVRSACERQRTGMGLEQSLRILAREAGTGSVDRFVDGLLVCLERGTPVAEVLRAQASDARAEQRRLLMEQAGRKDIAMLLPVVFLILPIVVVIAMYPGFTGIQLLVP